MTTPASDADAALEHVLATLRRRFEAQKRQADRSLAQLRDDQLHEPLAPGENSVAVLMTHLAGNMRSRWRDPLGSDGESPDRDRDGEFDPPRRSRAELEALWEEGWATLFDALDGFAPLDLTRELRIRGRPLTFAEAIVRQLDHYGHHVGQMVMLARHLAGESWATLSVPRGGSAAYEAAVRAGEAAPEPALVPDPPAPEIPASAARTWIERLGLERHPEGGWYRQIYRADEELPASALPPRYDGARATATVIWFLLEHPDVSHLHRLASDEIWHFHAGGPLRVVAIDEAGERSDLLLGPDPSAGESFVGVVPRGRWFGAFPPAGGWALVSCTVAPGFDFADFELAERGAALERWPQHGGVVERLTR